MIFTTMFLALIVIAILYFLAIRFIPWPALSYVLVVAVGLICLVQGDVHFRYVGIEVIGIGSFAVWLHYNVFKNRKDGEA